MSSIDLCWLCEEPITAEKATKEHIIPNSIGGRRKIPGFLCRACNSRTGHNWDDRLASQLSYFGLLFEVRRHRGAVPSIKATTASGETVGIRAGNRLVLGKPEVIRDDTGLPVRIRARSRKEARKMLKGLTRKYPQIDLEQTMQNLRAGGSFSVDPIGIAVDAQGPNTDRSIVKSAVALACEAGLTPADCDLAIAYLRDEDAEYEKDGFWHYYQRDLLVDRTIGLPLHCVYINGNSSSGLLLAYVEYYGVIRRVVCLSQGYKGRSVSRVYAVNPVTGEKLEGIEIDLDDTRFDIVKTQTAGGARAGLKEAAEQIMASGMLLSRCRQIAEVSVQCVKEYFERNGLRMTSEDHRDLVEEVAHGLMPLIDYYTKPMEFPEGFDPTSGAAE